MTKRTDPGYKCPSCKRTFASQQAFNFHRVGSYFPNRRRCLEFRELLARGMYFLAGEGWQKPNNWDQQSFKVKQCSTTKHQKQGSKRPQKGF